LNTLQWTGLTNIPAEQLQRISPTAIMRYTSTTAVNPGTVLAYMLGLGGNAGEGAKHYGADGQSYTFASGVWVLTSALPNDSQQSSNSGTVDAGGSQTQTGQSADAYANVGAALGVAASTVQNNLAGFLSYLGQQGVNAATAAASTITSAYQSWVSTQASDPITSSGSKLPLLLGAGAVAFLFFGRKK
jgi:hypothetical protein